jgi:O-antigen/teichoic acid export membrane protein
MNHMNHLRPGNPGNPGHQEYLGINGRSRLMSLTQRFAQGVFWNLIGLAASRLFTFTAALVTARFLGKHGFGELGMITSTVGALGSFPRFGIGFTANKYLAELKERESDRAGGNIALSNQIFIRK